MPTVPLTQDPFWRWVLTESPLKDAHWTREQLEALYADPAVSEAERERFDERTGMFRFESGFDELTAMNLAHVEAIWLIKEERVRLSDECDALSVRIHAAEKAMRRKGWRPEVIQENPDPPACFTRSQIEAAHFALSNLAEFDAAQIKRARQIIEQSIANEEEAVV